MFNQKSVYRFAWMTYVTRGIHAHRLLSVSSSTYINARAVTRQSDYAPLANKGFTSD